MAGHPVTMYNPESSTTDPFDYLSYTAEALADAPVKLFPAILPLQVDEYGTARIMVVRRDGTETSAPWAAYWENFVASVEDDGGTLLEQMADQFEVENVATIDKVLNAQLASVGSSEDGEYEVIYAWYVVRLHDVEALEAGTVYVDWRCVKEQEVLNNRDRFKPWVPRCLLRAFYELAHPDWDRLHPSDAQPKKLVERMKRRAMGVITEEDEEAEEDAEEPRGRVHSHRNS